MPSNQRTQSRDSDASDGEVAEETRMLMDVPLGTYSSRAIADDSYDGRDNHPWSHPVESWEPYAFVGELKLGNNDEHPQDDLPFVGHLNVFQANWGTRTGKDATHIRHQCAKNSAQILILQEANMVITVA